MDRNPRTRVTCPAGARGLGGAPESMVRMSVPPSSKCVAKLCLNACVVACLSIIASSTARRTARAYAPSPM